MLSYTLLILNALMLTITSQKIDCIGWKECKNDRLACNISESCSLTCNGSAEGQSCQKLKLDGSQASSVAVYCMNYQDCIQTEITCGTGPCHIYCQAEQSCKQQTLNCGSSNCIIECNAYQSCQDFSIDNTSQTQFTCIGDYCPSHLITNTTTTTTSISPTIIPTITPTITPTQQPNIETYSTIYPTEYVTSDFNTTYSGIETTVYTEYNPDLTEITEDDDNLSITETEGMGKLLTWINLIYLLLLLIFILCLLFCVYILCKMYNKPKEIDINNEKTIYNDVEMVDKTGTPSTTTIETETNEVTTNTNTINTLKRIITQADVREGEQNDESVIDISNKIDESCLIKHNTFDSVTLNEGIESTTHNTYNRSRMDTLENILDDVINEENSTVNNNNNNENSYVHNGEEKSILIKYHEETQNIKLILYDFDQTITTIHLYKELNGQNVNEMEMISNGRLIEIFGGNIRIKMLQKHFNYLMNKNIKLGIVSFGFEKVIENALYRMNMLQYFSFIVGRDSQSMKNAYQQKVFYILHLMKNENYNKSDILFIDDDPKNIEAIVKVDCCKTILIKPRIGMNEKHLKEIENNYVL